MAAAKNEIYDLAFGPTRATGLKLACRSGIEYAGISGALGQSVSITATGWYVIQTSALS